MNVMGYGVLRIHNRVELVFNYSTPMVKFPIAQVDYPTGDLAAPSIRRLQRCDTSEAHQYGQEERERTRTSKRGQSADRHRPEPPSSANGRTAFPRNSISYLYYFKVKLQQ